MATVFKLRWACMLLAVSAAGCSQPAQVDSAYGPGVRFSETARTFAWSPSSARTTGEGRPKNERVDTMIREIVESHLVKKGYEKAASGGTPDFWLDYRVATSLRGDPYGDIAAPQYKEGYLGLYVLDPATAKLIWRGTARARLDEATPPQEQRERLSAIIGEMIDQVRSAKSK